MKPLSIYCAVGAVLLMLLGVPGGKSALSQVYDCTYPESQSAGCKECSKACPTCTTYGKCGDPSDSGHCGDEEFNGSSHACEYIASKFCPGRGRIFNNATACGNNDMTQIVVDEPNCVMLNYNYSSAKSVATSNGCD